MKEIWRPVVDFPGYDVSNRGRVRSHYERLPGAGNWTISERPARVLSAYVGVRVRVGLMRDGHQYCRQVSRLVALAFLGDCPPGMIVCHNDDDPLNNNLDNLRYDTPMANTHEGKATKLTDGQVVEIRNSAAQGMSDEDLSRAYGLSLSHVASIRLGHKRRDAGGEITHRSRDRKLSAGDVQAIIRNVESGHRQDEQALLFGISESMVSLIVNGKRRQS